MNRLLLEKGKQYSRIVPTVVQVMALTIAAVLSYFGLRPVLTGFALLMNFSLITIVVDAAQKLAFGFPQFSH
jgi:hypothetical protein